MSMRPIPVTCDRCHRAFHVGTRRLGAEFCHTCKPVVEREQQQRKLIVAGLLNREAEFEAAEAGAGGDHAP